MDVMLLAGKRDDCFEHWVTIANIQTLTTFPERFIFSSLQKC